jgi:hypothetical protein
VPTAALAVDRAHWINPISIARAELGYRSAGYPLLFGPAERHGRVLLFKQRRMAVFVGAAGRGVGVQTWHADDHTLDEVGPCSSEDDFRHAYPDARKYGGRYQLGRLYFYASGGRITTVLLAVPTFDFRRLLSARC